MFFYIHFYLGLIISWVKPDTTDNLSLGYKLYGYLQIIVC